MATNANTTPTPTTPIVELSSPRKQAEDALYEAGVITDIISKLATLQIGSTEAVCGTSYEFLAGLLDERIDQIREQLAVGSFGRGG